MQTSDALETLIREHPFLDGLKPEFVDFFQECASVRRFASHQTIFQEGGEADHFYLILTGTVSLETFVPGHGPVTIQKLGPGEALGWSWLFAPFRWQFTATTYAPTEVISFNAEALRVKAADSQDFRDELLTRIAKTLLQRLQATRMQLVDLCSIHSPDHCEQAGS